MTERANDMADLGEAGDVSPATGCASTDNSGGNWMGRGRNHYNRAVQSVLSTWNAGIGNGEIPAWNGSERAERATTRPMHHLLCQGR